MSQLTSTPGAPIVNDNQSTEPNAMHYLDFMDRLILLTKDFGIEFRRADVIHPAWEAHCGQTMLGTYEAAIEAYTTLQEYPMTFKNFDVDVLSKLIIVQAQTALASSRAREVEIVARLTRYEQLEGLVREYFHQKQAISVLSVRLRAAYGDDKTEIAGLLMVAQEKFLASESALREFLK